MEKNVTKYYRRSFYSIGFMILFTLFTAIQAMAQNGKIVGLVSDSLSETGLVGANLYLTGTAMGAATNIEGEFAIMSVPPGSYTLEISYIGYHKKIIDVTIEPGEALVEKILLRPRILQSETVVITAQREGQLAAINKQIQADQLISVVSSERMREVPDANAAESVARLPGVSITRSGGEGSSVIIRGLAPEYNQISVNGVILPATGSGGRGTSISAIASENLAGIEVVKAITADMDAGQIGGSVNMVLAKARKKPFYAARLYGVYNTMSRGNYNQYQGFIQISDRFFDGKLGVQASINGERRTRDRDDMSAKYFQKTDFLTGELYYEVSKASVTDRREARDQYGASLVLDYALGSNEFQFSNMYTYRESESRTFTHGFGYYDQGYARPSLSEFNSMISTSILQGKHDLFGLETRWGISYGATRTETPFSHDVTFVEIHSPIPDKKLDVLDFITELENDNAAEAHTANFKSNKTSEDRSAITLDFKYPFNFSEQVSAFFKFGGKWMRTTKDKSNRKRGSLASQLGNKVYYPDWIEHGYDPGLVLGGRTTIGIVLDPMKNRELYDYAMAHSSSYQEYQPMAAKDDYDLEENLYAAFMMLNLKYKKLITFIPGVRLEAEDNLYTGTYWYRDGDSPDYQGSIYYKTTAHRTNRNFFPMIHLQVYPLNWLNIRLSYTETISRPGYSGLIPHERRYPYPNVNMSIGMPNLRSAVSKNYDAYANFFSSIYGLFGAGFFYKEIADFSYGFSPNIGDAEEAAFYGLPPDGDDVEKNQFTNRYVSLRANLPDISYVSGFEIDFQPNFAVLPGLLSGIVVHANYTKIWSSSMLPHREVKVISFYPYVEEKIIKWRKERLPQQADDLYNISLGYEYRGLSALVSLVHQGSVMSGVGPMVQEDTYTDAFERIDFTIKQDIGDHIVLYLNGVNLSDTPDQRVQAKTRKYRSIAYYGSQYQLGVQYKL